MLALSWPEAMLPADESAKRGFAERKREHGSRTPQPPWLMADRWRLNAYDWVKGLQAGRLG